jgi:hypothetical protein
MDYKRNKGLKKDRMRGKGRKITMEKRCYLKI